MVDFEDEDVEFLKSYIKLAARMSTFLKTKGGYPLLSVNIVGEGKGFYWSLADKKFILVDKGSDFYFVHAVEKDDKDRVCLFTPHLFGIGQLIMVPEDEIIIIGFN